MISIHDNLMLFPDFFYLEESCQHKLNMLNVGVNYFNLKISQKSSKTPAVREKKTYVFSLSFPSKSLISCRKLQN